MFWNVRPPGPRPRVAMCRPTGRAGPQLQRCLSTGRWPRLTLRLLCAAPLRLRCADRVALAAAALLRASAQVAADEAREAQVEAERAAAATRLSASQRRRRHSRSPPPPPLLLAAPHRGRHQPCFTSRRPSAVPHCTLKSVVRTPYLRNTSSLLPPGHIWHSADNFPSPPLTFGRQMCTMFVPLADIQHGTSLAV